MTERVDPNSSHEKSRRREALFICASVAAAFALRAWALSRRGVLDYDETYYYILGRNLLAGRGYTLNGLPHTAFGPLYPLLVGLAGLFTSSVRLAASSVSALAGALLPVPVYFLARDIRGRRTAVISSAASAVWPALFFYAARSVRYADRLYAGSEPLFLTLLVSGILFFWLAARGGKRRHAALAGLFCGLAVLARDEAVVIFAFLCAWLVLETAFERGRRARGLAQAALAAAVLIVSIAPVLIHVRSRSGRWGLGSKLPNFMRTRPALWEWVEEGRGENYLRAHYALSPDGTRMNSAYWGISEWHRSEQASGGMLASGLALVGSPDWRWLAVFGRVFVKGGVPLVPRYAWPFIVLGLAGLLRDRTRLRLLALFGFLLAAQLWMGVSIYVLARLELPLVPVLALLAGDGLDLTGKALARGAGAVKSRARVLGRAVRAAPAVLVLLLMCRSGVLANLAGGRGGGPPGAVSSTAFDGKVAEALKGALPPGSTLMCNKPWIALRAGMDWRVSPDDTPERILKYATAAGIDYAVLGPWQVPVPAAGGALYPYFEKTFGDGDRLFLFDFTRAGSFQTPSPSETGREFDEGSGAAVEPVR